MPTVPEHTVWVHAGGQVTRAAGFAEELASRLRLRQDLPMHVHCAFGGTSDLCEYQAGVVDAYAGLAAEWRTRSAASQLIVIDGATRMGHIVHLEQVLDEVKRSTTAVASLGVTSAASLREDGAAAYNRAHELSLIVDSPDEAADWGFETVFFLQAVELLCGTHGRAAELSVCASFVNGGMVTAKELAFMGLALPRMAAKVGARAEIAVAGRTGRLAGLAAEARAQGAPLLVELPAAGYVVEMRFGEVEVVSRVVPGTADPGGISVTVSRPLLPSEADYLQGLAWTGAARACSVRFLP